MSGDPEGGVESAASLDRLAELVADGLQVDWEAERKSGVGRDRLQDELLIALRAVEAVGSAARPSGGGEESEASGGRPISSWGDLEVLRTLGRGSFGEVYLARDPLLNRLVALKLYTSVGSDPTECDKILLEGRLLARLRHPNIATVHGVDRHDHRFGMWMEFVDGETLANAVRDRGCLSPQEVAVIGSELCHALAEVHRLGILHRDIKAQNVIRERGGRLVLIDFGLGLEERRAALTGPSGTPLYLAPELLSGGQPSVATDIYALGVLLFFLVTGGYPFEGGTLEEVRVAHAESRRRLLRDVRPDVTARLAQVIERATEADPAARFRSVGELEAALAGAVVPHRKPSKTLLATVAGMLAVGIVAAGVLGWHEARGGKASSPLFQGGMSRRLTATPEWETEPALSPDGSFVAYASNRGGNFDLWLMDTTGSTPMQLTSGPAEDRRPRWFPDGTRLVFESVRDGVPSVWTIGRLGGQPEFVLDRAGDPAVSPDGRSLAVSLVDPSGTRRIAVLGLDNIEAGPKVITGAADGFWDYGRPAWSPDGRTICYQDLSNLWLVDVEGGAPRQLTMDSAGYQAPIWAPSGREVYSECGREGTTAIWRVAIDGSDSERVTYGTGSESAPSLAADGRRLAYATMLGDMDIVVASLGTAATHPIRSEAMEMTPAVAPSGSFVVFASERQAGWGLWRVDLRDGIPVGEPLPLVRGRHALSNPAISADERWVAYHGREGDRRGVFVSPVSGGTELRVSPQQEDGIHPSWSPTGSEIFWVAIRDGMQAVVAARFDDGRVSPPRVVLHPPVTTVMHPRVSPDGRDLAFIGEEGEAAEAWVAALGKTPVTARKLTNGARAEDLAWLGDRRLAVSGLWDGSRLRLRSVSLDGFFSDVAPTLDLGTAGTFSLANGGETIAFARAEPRGDLWLVESR